MISLTFCTPKRGIYGNRPGDFGAVACVHPPSPRFRPSPAPFGGSLAREARPRRGRCRARAGGKRPKCGGGSRTRGNRGRSVGLWSGSSCPAGGEERTVLSPRSSKVGAGVSADPTQWGAGRRRASPSPCGRAGTVTRGRRGAWCGNLVRVRSRAPGGHDVAAVAAPSREGGRRNTFSSGPTVRLGEPSDGVNCDGSAVGRSCERHGAPWGRFR